MLAIHDVIIMQKREFDTFTITKNTPLQVVEYYGRECTGCGKCCNLDSGIVLEEDIPRLASNFGLTEKEFSEKYLVEHEKFNTKVWKLKQEKKQGKPYGRCVLLNEKNQCSVHEIKPLHCRACSTASKHGEQLSLWFTLNHLVNPNDPESIRQWAQYLQTHPTIPGGNLQDLVPDKERLAKILSYEIFR